MPEPESQTKQANPSNAPARSFKVLNNTLRPLVFRITGRTIRLSPGEISNELGEHHASAPELRTLCAKGAALLLRTESTGAEEPPKLPVTDLPEGKRIPERPAEVPAKQAAAVKPRAKS